MPCSHSIDAELRFGLLRFWGDVNGRQLHACACGLFDEEALGVGFRLLWDAREVESLDLGLDEVSLLASFLRSVRPRIGAGRSAIVASAPNVVTSGHLLRALVARDSSREVRIFGDVDEAIRWLTDDPPDVAVAIRRMVAQATG